MSAQKMPGYVSYVTYVVDLFMRRVSAAHDDFMVNLLISELIHHARPGC
jgi:hypothetical protein